MTNSIPREEWGEFFKGLSKRTTGWKSKVEVLNKDIGDQILDDGLPLVGITAAERGGKVSLEISVGKDAGHHQTHSIQKPVTVAFVGKGSEGGGVVEIVEEEGTTTLVHIENPMPVGILGAGSDAATAAADPAPKRDS